MYNVNCTNTKQALKDTHSYHRHPEPLPVSVQPLTSQSRRVAKLHSLIQTSSSLLATFVRLSTIESGEIERGDSGTNWGPFEPRPILCTFQNVHSNRLPHTRHARTRPTINSILGRGGLLLNVPPRLCNMFCVNINLRIGFLLWQWPNELCP